MTGFVQVLLSGLVDGCVCALIALGMSIVYSISRIINLAQGGFVVLAALTAVSRQQHLQLAPLLSSRSLAPDTIAHCPKSVCSTRFGGWMTPPSRR
ncbi:hypothetical protein DI005_08955 [Prauserella sp. PE36]|uniref:ABC transporter permease subunit n=1 Tax=Prauserella sp. PE36 TaxID=1504709 RepID=UPI000DE48412|nr:hypothetical protein [Prauserella sp. PE36]RBM21650.1 hypothetical protein DI005_08955 [Prauserella sp. PE36]